MAGATPPATPPPYSSQTVANPWNDDTKIDFRSLEINVEHPPQPGGRPPLPPLPLPIAQDRKRDGTIHVVTIPESQIPSPFAPSITPSILIHLRAWLVPKETEQAQIGYRRAGNGLEVWKSWKRAYDLWNNFYIEGRVDPKFVKARWDEKEPQRKEEQESRWHNRPPDPNLLASFSWTESAVSKNHPPHGGPMKDWEEFKVRPERPLFDDDADDDDDDDHDINDRPDQDSVDDSPYFDPIQNTVWMPLRRGEKKLKIEVDEWDPQAPDKYFTKNDLEVNGGVNCGRFPHPALRPLIQYTSTGNPLLLRSDGNETEGTIIKKRTWDEVKTTIYNMPIPIPDQPKDPETDLIKVVYRDTIRDADIDADKIFPLRIHRVLQVLDANDGVDLVPGKSKATGNVAPPGETLLLDRDFNSGKCLVPYKHMEKDDPWYITPCQKNLREFPPRRWSPEKKDRDGESLKVDDTLWNDEFYKDSWHQAQYFVTNLHGGNLFINGMKVPQGAVAGPMPRFATIETPGGQVSWWHGIDGRDYVPGKTDGNFPVNPTDARKWETLQALGGEWKHAGMPAAQVWDKKIDDRYEREKKGTDQDDDHEWDCWKTGLHCCENGQCREVEEDSDTNDPNELPPREGRPHTQRTFTGDDELKYAVTLYDLRERRLAQGTPTSAADRLLTPQPDLWPGPVAPAVPLEQQALDRVTEEWPNIVGGLQASQARINEQIRLNLESATIRNDAATIDNLQATLKRARDDAGTLSSAPASKRVRFADDVDNNPNKTFIDNINARRELDQAANEKYTRLRNNLQDKAAIAVWKKANNSESDEDARNALKQQQSARHAAYTAALNRINQRRQTASKNPLNEAPTSIRFDDPVPPPSRVPRQAVPDIGWPLLPRPESFTPPQVDGIPISISKDNYLTEALIHKTVSNTAVFTGVQPSRPPIAPRAVPRPPQIAQPPVVTANVIPSPVTSPTIGHGGKVTTTDVDGHQHVTHITDAPSVDPQLNAWVQYLEWHDVQTPIFLAAEKVRAAFKYPNDPPAVAHQRHFASELRSNTRYQRGTDYQARLLEQARVDYGYPLLPRFPHPLRPELAYDTSPTTQPTPQPPTPIGGPRPRRNPSATNQTAFGRIFYVFRSAIDEAETAQAMVDLNFTRTEPQAQLDLLRRLNKGYTDWNSYVDELTWAKMNSIGLSESNTPTNVTLEDEGVTRTYVSDAHNFLFQLQMTALHRVSKYPVRNQYGDWKSNNIPAGMTQSRSFELVI